MKKVLAIICLVVLTTGLVTSCTNESFEEEQAVFAVDPDEVEDPDDRGND